MSQAVSFPKHISVKPSSVEWLGDIPSTWSLESIRAVTQLKSEKNQPDLQVLSVYREYGVIPKDSRDDNHNATSLDTSGYKVVNEGDLVVNKMKAWQGSMGVSEHHGIVSPAYITCRVDASRVYPKFLHYLLRSRPYIGVYNSLSYGVRVGQWDMHYEDFKRIPLPLPEASEQQRIANFLDHKTTEIYQAIAKKKRLIELLKEQKAILINQAVTKGLNPDARMHDSGVEWIGEVPEHWSVVRLKHLSKKITDGEHISPSLIDEGIPLLSAKDVRHRDIKFNAAAYVSEVDAKKFRKRCNPEKGDLLIVSRGATVGRIGFVETDREFCLMGSVILVKPNERIDPGFLYYSLNQDDVQRSILQISDASAQQAVYLVDVKETIICTPTLSEQRAVYEYLQPRIAGFDQAIELQEKAIVQLTELKAVIISNAVTGKVKL